MIKIDTLYVDLDGVLVNFELGIHDVIQDYIGPKRDKIDNDVAVILDEMFVKLEELGYEKAGELLANRTYKDAIRLIIGMEPEWWAHLEWMPDGKVLWDAIKGYNPIVLSSPLNKTKWDEKNTWVARELGKHVKVLIEDDKEIHADPGALLIDDRPHHSKFEEHGGHVILHTSAADSIKQLEDYDLSALAPGTAPQVYEKRRIHNFSTFVNESYEQKSTTIKWRPSKNDAVEGFISKTFPHNKGVGDKVADQDKVKEKWSKRLSSILGAAIDLSKTDMFPLEKGKSYRGAMDFKFEDADGEKYRIYQDGEGPKSASYTIQKYKK